MQQVQVTASMHPGTHSSGVFSKERKLCLKWLQEHVVHDVTSLYFAGQPYLSSFLLCNACKKFRETGIIRNICHYPLPRYSLLAEYSKTLETGHLLNDSGLWCHHGWTCHMAGHSSYGLRMQNAREAGQDVWIPSSKCCSTSLILAKIKENESPLGHFSLNKI